MRKCIAVIGLLTVFAGPGAIADADGCRDAVSTYNGSLDEIDSYLRRYSRCVSGSQGQDDCSSEFRRLRNAQNDFESAVSAFISECD